MYFPTADECDGSITPTRQITVPVTFEDVMQYKQVFKAALRGELNAVHRSTLLLSLINESFLVLVKIIGLTVLFV